MPNYQLSILHKHGDILSAKFSRQAKASFLTMIRPGESSCGITAMVLLTTILLFRRGQIIDRIESVKTTAQSGYDQTASRAKISSALDKIGNHGNDISHATPAVPPLHRELTTEELFKLAAPSVVLVEVFNNSGLRSGTGSGFVAADGAVVTNYHVIRGAYSANVHLQDGSTIPVQGVIGYDQTRDVAVVKFRLTTIVRSRS